MEPEFTLEGHKGAVTRVSWSPDDSYLASASIDNSIRLWDMGSGGSQLCILLGHTNYLRSVEWSRSGDFLASCGDDGTIRFWNMKQWRKDHAADPSTGQTILKDDMGIEAYCLKWGPGDKWLVSGHNFWDVKIWDTRNIYNITQMCTLPVEQEHHVHGVTCTNDGQYIAYGGSERCLRVFKYTEGQGVPTPFFEAENCHRYQIWDVEFSPNGKFIATTGADGDVRIWSMDAMEKTKKVSLGLIPKYLKEKKAGKHVHTERDDSRAVVHHRHHDQRPDNHQHGGRRGEAYNRRGDIHNDDEGDDRDYGTPTYDDDDYPKLGKTKKEHRGVKKHGTNKYEKGKDEWNHVL
jgi:WD40 repeat protein